MSIAARVGLVVLWALSIVTVAALAQGQIAPQAPASPAATVVSGNDIGFRVEGQRGNVPTGRLVVRWNGQWIEPLAIPGVRPAKD